MASSLLSEMSNTSRSICIGGAGAGCVSSGESSNFDSQNENETSNTKRVLHNGRAFAPKSCSIAVPFSHSKYDNNNLDNFNNLYHCAQNTYNFNIANDYSPRVARSYYKNDSSFDENSQPSSFTSSFINSHHKKHRNHFYSHYVNGSVFYFRMAIILNL